MHRLHQLSEDHEQALLRFEEVNRRYFAAQIGDRGDEYFTRFAHRHGALLEEQEQGLGHFHVIIDSTGEIVGRVNLVDIAAGSADLGYRIAEGAIGQGLATWAVREVCVLATNRYALMRLTAGTAEHNIGSQKVLERNGFTIVDRVSRRDITEFSYRKDL